MLETAHGASQARADDEPPGAIVWRGRRVKVIPHFFAEKAGMKLVYATMLAASAKWRGGEDDTIDQPSGR